jgi:hypothetical protein
MARTDLQCLLNEPVTINLGTKAKPVKVTLTEPANADFAKMSILFDTLAQKFMKDNGAFFQTAWSKGATAAKKENLDLSSLAAAADPFIAHIIGKPDAFVAKMPIRQKVFVLEQYGNLIGWGFITDRFKMATRNLLGLIQPKENAAAPSWLQPSSPTSAARSRS